MLECALFSFGILVGVLAANGHAAKDARRRVRELEAERDELHGMLEESTDMLWNASQGAKLW